MRYSHKEHPAPWIERDPHLHGATMPPEKDSLTTRFVGLIETISGVFQSRQHRCRVVLSYVGDIIQGKAIVPKG